MDRPLSWPAVVVGIAVAAALPALLATDPAPTADTFWHLRVGRDLWESGRLPTTDPYSQTGRAESVTWIAYSWLYEVGLDRAFAAGGWRGIFAVRGLLVFASVATVVGFALRRLGATPAGLAAAVLAGICLAPLSLERSWHATIVYTTLVLWATVRMREGELVRSFLWLPITFILWANLHIQFPLGLAVLGLATLFPGSAPRRHLASLTAICTLATLANPYHVRLFAVVVEYATQTGPLRVVQELAPPECNSPWLWAAASLLTWAAVQTARRRPVDGFSVLLLLLAVVLVLRMRRDVWFGAVTAIAVLRPSVAAPAFPRGIVAATVATVLAVALGFARWDTAAAISRSYPAKAVEYVRETQPIGPLFNAFDWGGYLIFALPEYPVLIDGRTNLYGSERVVRNLATAAGEPGWESDPDLASANVAILPRAGKLWESLAAHPDWHLAHEDSTALVFVRRR